MKALIRKTILALSVLVLLVGGRPTTASRPPLTGVTTAGNLEQTLTGFYFPVGKPYSFSNCGTWLGRDKANGGCYHKDRYHLGMDILAEVDTPVYPIADGTVVRIGTSAASWGQGNVAVIVKHKLADGIEFLALYGHIVTSVKTTSEVKAGVSFGKIGFYEGGNHLHFGIHPSLAIPVVTNTIGWGRAFNSEWPSGQNPNTNGFVDPISWINSKSPQCGNQTSECALAGFHDGSNCDKIFGWAWNRTQPNTPVNVEVYDGNTKLATVPANGFRQDLLDNGIGDGRHAFNFTTPPSLKDGRQHSIIIKIENSSFQLGNSNQLFNSSCGSTPTAVISMSGGNQSGGTGHPLSLAVPRGGNIQVNFNAFASKAGALAVKAYKWVRQSFLGNKSQGSQIATETTSTVAPSFYETLGPGTHNVTLEVSDEADGKDSTTATITISESTSTPSISSINPTSLAPSIFDLTINGTGFDGAAIDQIYFGSSFVGNGTIISRTATQIVVRESMSIATLGTYTVKVKNSDGQLSNGVPLVLTQTQTPAPVINSISPSSVSASVFDLTINGSNFDSGAIDQIYFGNNFVGNGTILSRTSTRIVVRESMSSAALGTYNVKVKNSDGQLSNGLGLSLTQQQTSTPTVNSIAPSSPTRNDSNQNVNVAGSSFQPGLTVTVFIPGGGSATLSGTQIQNVTSSSFTIVVTLNVVGQYGIRVNNPDGGQSGTFNFNVQNSTSTPQINSISPTTPTRSGSDQSVQVSGGNFQSGLTVTVFIPGGGTATLSGSQIQSVTAGSFTMVVTLNVAGTYGIRVNNPDGGQSNTFNFTTQAPTVSIGSISPSTPTRSGSDQNVVVNGSGFQSGLTITVFIPGGGTATLSGTQIQGVTLTSFTMVVTLNVPGTYGIRVNNPDSSQSNTFNFTTQAPTVSISSISPASPTRSGSDQNVLVNGAGFQTGLTVTVFIPGGGTATLSGTQIQGVTPASFTMVVTLNVAGTYGIRVNNPDSSQSNTFNFTTQAPTGSIGSISPSSPTRSGSDQNVLVNGAGFQSGLTVTVFIPGGGTATLNGTQIQGVTPTSFTMVVTLNVAGTYGIRVNNPDSSQSNTFNFTTQAPTVSIGSISPSTPTRSGSDQNVVVNGSGFQSGLTVTVFIPGGGTATLSGSQIQSVTAGSFTMIVTLNVAGTYGIRVNNPDGGQSNTFNFTTQAPTVSISSISPSTPTRSGSNQNVQVFGSNFQSGLTVTVFIPGGGTSTLSGSQIQSVTSGSFTMVITLNVAGTYGIRVNNPDAGQSNTFNFTTQAATPSISSISPSTPTRSGSDQNVQVSGGNFQSGLTVTVFIPGGGTSTLSGSQIQSVTSSSFTMVITLNVAGTYGIRVNNPDGSQSNTFNFTTQAATPSISSISPSSPVRSSSNQNVSVFGGNFQSGLTVLITFPGGGNTTLSGSQIQSVTGNSFIMVVTLSAPGSWSIRVNNPGGSQSNTFFFTVQ